MHHAAVHEHIGEELIEMEVLGEEEVQAEQIVEVYAHAEEHFVGKESYHVDDKQIFGNGWNISHNYCINGYLRRKSTKKSRYSA